MKRPLLMLFCFSCFQLAANVHRCPHFGNCLLEHARVEQASTTNEPSEKRVVASLPESFGKTHFIVGASPEEVQQELHLASPDKQQQAGVNYSVHEGFDAHAFFSPDDGLEHKLIELIAQEQDSMKIAVFLFTNGNIAQALVDAKKRGITIELVTDASCLQDKFNKIAMLREAGIKICVYKPESTALLGNRMHHKYIIFGKNKEGKSWLWFGSFNLTKSADLYNQEGVILLDNGRLIDQFSKQFDVLKQRCLSYEKAMSPVPLKMAGRVSKNLKRITKKTRNARIVA